MFLLLVKAGVVEKAIGPVSKDNLASASLVLSRFPEYKGCDITTLPLEALKGLTEKEDGGQ